MQTMHLFHNPRSGTPDIRCCCDTQQGWVYWRGDKDVGCDAPIFRRPANLATVIVNHKEEPPYHMGRDSIQPFEPCVNNCRTCLDPRLNCFEPNPIFRSQPQVKQCHRKPICYPAEQYNTEHPLYGKRIKSPKKKINCRPASATCPESIKHLKPPKLDHRGLDCQEKGPIQKHSTARNLEPRSRKTHKNHKPCSVSSVYPEFHVDC